MIYSTNRIDYTESVDVTPDPSTYICMNLDEVSLLFEDIDNTIFETLIEADFNEALAIREAEEKDDNKDDNENDSENSDDKKEETADQKEKKKTFWEKVKEFFKKIGERIKAFIAGIRDKFLQVLKNDKKLYEKYKDRFKIENLKGFELEDCYDIKKFNELDNETKKYYQQNKDAASGELQIEIVDAGKLKKLKENKEKINEIKEKMKDLSENKITWKPTSDNDISDVLEVIKNDNFEKEVEKIVKSIERFSSALENSIKKLESQLNDNSAKDFKELCQEKIEFVKAVIDINNIIIKVKKEQYKDARKKFISMINYIRKNRAKDAEDKEDSEEEPNEDNNESGGEGESNSSNSGESEGNETKGKRRRGPVEFVKDGVKYVANAINGNNEEKTEEEQESEDLRNSAIELGEKNRRNKGSKGKNNKPVNRPVAKSAGTIDSSSKK